MATKKATAKKTTEKMVVDTEAILNEADEFVETDGVDAEPEAEAEEVIEKGEVKDITLTEAKITKDTVFKVKKSFNTILGVNGTTGANTGDKIKLSNLDEKLIFALIKQGYIEIIK